LWLLLLLSVTDSVPDCLLLGDDDDEDNANDDDNDADDDRDADDEDDIVDNDPCTMTSSEHASLLNTSRLDTPSPLHLLSGLGGKLK